MNLSYSDEKRLILSTIEIENIMLFIADIPLKERQGIFNHLVVKVNGFRPNTRQYLERKMQIYLQRRHHWSEREWNIFVQLWLQWTMGHPKILTNIGCSKLDEVVNIVSEMSADEDVMIKYFDGLSNAEYSVSVSRRDLRNWFDFGPFNPNDCVAALIERAPTEKFLQFVAKADTIQSTLNGLEGRLQQVIEHVSTSREELWTAVNETLTKVQKFTSAIEDVSDRQQHLQLAHEENAKAGELSLRGVQAELEERIVRLEQETSQFNVRFQDSLARTTNVIDHLSSGLGTLSVVQGRRNDKNFDVSKLQSEPGPIDIIETTDALISKIRKSVNSLGVQLSDAKLVAAIVTASVGAGQLTTFTGSYSLTIARCCALSLAGDAVYIVRVPTGLLDFNEIWSGVDELIKDASGKGAPIGVIFEGLNRAFCSASGNRLKELIEERMLGVTDGQLRSPYLFATLVDGPAGLQERAPFEMGPVLYTDILQWKKTPGFIQSPSKAAGAVWNGFTEGINSHGSMVTEHEEILPEWLSPHLSALSYRVFHSAFHYLNMIDYANADRALSFGWIAPCLINFNRSEFDRLVDDDYFDEKLSRPLEALVKLVDRNGYN
ncbi:hypothetical protein [Ferroacidibacillus organovorans]|uniref:Uncharacterized protein n=1 Tax=Ferroacidibacillus organovorans TaxID=1765683 RepID=A0A101XRE9_9BACL|nr:hypothetical protein [Ferroacidibacillus organovorans]KUO96132.1 hypothetical protein ATW55_14460 [Ferroacidibacillus organovorans]